MPKQALILIDIQNDFLPGGALAVPGGDQVITVANELINSHELVIASQDWHPADHGSFAANHEGKHVYETIKLNGLDQTLWPVHCVEDTQGAEFSELLDCESINRVFRKGCSRDIDSYSAFYDNGHLQSTGLSEWLKSQGVTDLSICGLATDYCVKFSCLDALNDGFHVTLHLAGCRGVNISPGDVDQAIAEMKAAGAEIR